MMGTNEDNYIDTLLLLAFSFSMLQTQHVYWWNVNFVMKQNSLNLWDLPWFYNLFITLMYQIHTILSMFFFHIEIHYFYQVALLRFIICKVKKWKHWFVSNMLYFIILYSNGILYMKFCSKLCRGLYHEFTMIHPWLWS